MNAGLFPHLKKKSRVEIKPILKDFSEMSGLAHCYIVHEDKNWYKLWRAVIAILKDDTLNEDPLFGVRTIHMLVRDCFRVPTRDIVEDFLFLCKFAHLTLSSNTTGEQQLVDAAEVEQPDKASFHPKLVIETLNLLSDLITDHCIYRSSFVHCGIVEALLKRICSGTVYPAGVMFAYVELLWRCTRGPCVCDRIQNNLNAIEYIIEMLDGRGIEIQDTDEQFAVLHKLVIIMRAVTWASSKIFSELQRVHLTGVIRRLLLRFGGMKNSFEKDFIYDTIRLLINVSRASLSELVTKCEPAEVEASPSAQLLVFEGWNVRALEIILRYLQLELNQMSISRMVPWTVPPLLRLLTECAHCHRIMRRYIRSVVLPPLRDLSKHPEEGFTLRDYLCRLLTNGSDRFAANLLFVCCKENVSRMIKYTGYDKIAEIFPDLGKCAEYSSDSEDSDNEEYNQVVLSWMKIPEFKYEPPCCS